MDALLKDEEDHQPQAKGQALIMIGVSAIVVCDTIGGDVALMDATVSALTTDGKNVARPERGHVG